MVRTKIKPVLPVNKNRGLIVAEVTMIAIILLVTVIMSMKNGRYLQNHTIDLLLKCPQKQLV